MPEFINRISNQLTDIWGKFSAKQKVQIGISVVIAVLAITILVVILNRPSYVLLEDDLEPSKVNEITAALQSANIEYQIGDNAKSISVKAADKKDAILALAGAGIVASGDMQYKDLFNNSVMTSNSEQTLKAKLYYETELGNRIEMIDGIDEASVQIVLPDKQRTILEEKSKAKASVIVKTNRDLEETMATNIAKDLASAVEGLDIDNITILDTNARLLFDGQSMNGEFNGLTNRDYETKQEALVTNKVRSVLLAAGEYDYAEVAVDLVIDYDKQEVVTEKKTTQDGSNTGIIDNQSTYTEETNNTTSGGVPGTDSNATTDTMISSGGDSSSNINETKTDYVYDTEVTKASKGLGKIIYNNSTVTVSLTKYKDYNQAIIEKQEDSPLKEQTWEEYKYSIEQQGNQKISNIDNDIIELIGNASNISNVKVIAYEVPRFIDKQVEPSKISDYVLIAIIVVMILLLGFAVYRSTEPAEISETEPELSVEELLESTKEQSDLESIEYENKSEARVQIEEFVSGQPEAAALLLRNWLNEEWEG